MLAGPLNKVSPNLLIASSSYLIHHQLRLNTFIRYINSVYEIFSLSKTKKLVNDTTIIVNFNYDYTFIRRLFPKNKMITIINDDFVAQAKLNKGKHVTKSLKLTCSQSDKLLAVSYPLVETLKSHQRTDLFLPWATDDYTKPIQTGFPRKKILIWGFINNRIDFSYLRRCIELNKNFEFLLVGPIRQNLKRKVEQDAKKISNLKVLGTMPLADLPIDEVLCAFVPYKMNTPFGSSVTILNKGFQILSFGLPLIVRGMPNFIKAKCIFPIEKEKDLSATLNHLKDNFDKLQPDIEKLIDNNSKSTRYNEFMEIVRN